MQNPAGYDPKTPPEVHPGLELDEALSEESDKILSFRPSVHWAF